MEERERKAKHFLTKLRMTKISRYCPVVLALLTVLSLIPGGVAADQFQCVTEEGTCESGSIDCNDNKNIFFDEECNSNNNNNLVLQNYNSLDDLDECNDKFKEGNSLSTLPQDFDLSSSTKPHPTNIYYFQLELNWTPWTNAKGYHVTIQTQTTDHDKGLAPREEYAYSCTEHTNTTIFIEYGYPKGYTTCDEKRNFVVKIKGLPTDSDVLGYREQFPWPDNCFFISDENDCGPHTPQSQSSAITVRTELLPNQTDLMSAIVSWIKPNNTQFDITQYNLLLYQAYDYHEFTVSNTTSVIFSPLNISLLYMFSLEPFQRKVCQHECHGTQHGRRNCGHLVAKTVSYSTPSSSVITTHTPFTDSYLIQLSSPSESISSSSSVSSSSSSSSSSSVTPNSRSTTQSSALNQKTYYAELMAGVAVTLLIIVASVLIALTLLIKLKCWKDRSGRQDCDQGEDILKTESDVSSSTSTTRSPTPSSPWSPLSPNNGFQFVYPLEAVGITDPLDSKPLESKPPGNQMPSYYREPKDLPDGVRLVLVVESLRLSVDEQDINQVLLGNDLNAHKDLHVLHYNTSSRRTPSEWLMNNMRKADAVLCICTKEFEEEWNGRNNAESLVHPLRQYVISSNNQGNPLSSKYIVITHDKEQKEKCIPEDLKGVRHCFINDTDRLYQIITETPSRIVS